MRRADKEITHRSEIDAVIAKCRICHLAFAVHDRPYVLPISFGYDGQCLYVHTAEVGKKIDCIRVNPQVCFAMECNVRLITEAPNPCGWGFAFESVIGDGRIEELMTPEEKAFGLNQIVRHYANAATPLEPLSQANLRVWRIRIESLTGKRSPPEAAVSL
jgi:uncharacterized protein